ncbi:hypothetical protein [Amycolatopsis speibonae]|uniref:Cupin n=1 Tax=Amycolatopsis speibonae TaxID=1450224 RepID=A0ABV7P8G8_9PSEU
MIPPPGRYADNPNVSAEASRRSTVAAFNVPPGSTNVHDHPEPMAGIFP